MSKKVTQLPLTGLKSRNDLDGADTKGSISLDDADTTDK